MRSPAEASRWVSRRTMRLSGRYDEMTPALVRPLVDGLRDVECVVFEDSAHLTTADEPSATGNLESFLSRVEARAN
jgi:pimeloyl-ACP methyl ester carboxylesterase